MAPVGTEHRDQEAEPSGDGTVSLTGRERNETSEPAKHADSYAIPPTPVISAQV
jgi:hypothetical protein